MQWKYKDNRENKDRSFKTLLPKILDKDDDAYEIVTTLDSVLSCAKTEGIRNIALTGPFGSGKSSILNTLENDFKMERSYLKISLATLQANNEQCKQDKQSEQEDLSLDSQGGDQSNKDKETANKIDSKSDEALNRQIEYSILQQLIYREKACTVPNSRISRIIHHDSKKLFIYALCSVITVIAFFIVFVPTIASTLSHNLLNESNIVTLILEIISRIWLVFALYKIFHYIYKTYGNSKLNKLNFKDGTIEIGKDTSIFNKHLDEILYFFQVTNYDVVIIEDLDRFDSPNIFLKLRELNFIINESKIVNRHVTFVYAIKDDMFKDEDRTKFFDYIIPIIPVINSSNSDALLKKELSERKLENDISDDDIAEIAFFIQDMRILINIVNEYEQYRGRLCQDKQSLNYTKLIAMITYKNYYPKDFADLHYRKGRIYACFEKKKDYITKLCNEKKAERDELIKNLQSHLDLDEKELRIVFLHNLLASYDMDTNKIQINNKSATLNQIADDVNLFEILYNSSKLSYKNSNGYPISKNVNMKLIDDKMRYTERINTLKFDIDKRLKELQNEISDITSLKLTNLITQYNININDLLAPYKSEPMLDVFIRRGFIDENYYDYISYFYSGMISPSDRSLIIAIKTSTPQPYDKHIDKMENFIKQLKAYDFQSDAILNNELLDYLIAIESQKDYLELLMEHLTQSTAYMPFLAQYYVHGKQQEKVFHYILQLGEDKLWEQIRNLSSAEKRDNLTEGYLKFCGELNEEQQEWLNDNCSFLAKHEDTMGYDRCIELIIPSKFKSIDSENTNIIDCIIENNCYAITLNNLVIIAKELGVDSVTKDNLNITRLYATQNDNVKCYVNENINDVISCLKGVNKDENSKVLLEIVNNNAIDESDKKKYLEGQINKIDDIKDIKNKTMYDFILENNLLLPTWENVYLYFDYTKKVLKPELVEFLQHNAKDLSCERFDCDDDNGNLFTKMFTSNDIVINDYELLLKSFKDWKFDSCGALKNVYKERLLILIDNEKLPFKENIISVINQTETLAEYLIHYHDLFIENLQSEKPITFNITKEVAIKILESSKFSSKDKKDVIKNIPKEVKKSSELANILVDIYDETNFNDEDYYVVLAVLKNAKKTERVIYLAIGYIRIFSSVIKEILMALGTDYECIALKKDDTKLKASRVNKTLLDTLKERQYISSYEEVNEKKKKYYDVFF